MSKVSLTISSKYNNITIKEFLKMCHIGKGKIESIRVNKTSFVNDTYRDLDSLIFEGDILSFIDDEKNDFLPYKGQNLDVLYEDDYLLVVNKPSDMIIYPDDKNNVKKANTLANLVSNYYISKGLDLKVRYLHRIDKDTTGIVLFAKDFISEGILLKDIETHDVKRDYLALVEGKYKIKKGTIDKPIGKDKNFDNKMKIDSNGKSAITTYKVIKEFDNYSLVSFSLKTGRTHQIRVHSAYLNHPLLGDKLYGTNSMLNRVALHSYHVKFVHPITQQIVELSANLPLDMAKFIN